MAIPAGTTVLVQDINLDSSGNLAVTFGIDIPGIRPRTATSIIDSITLASIMGSAGPNAAASAVISTAWNDIKGTLAQQYQWKNSNYIGQVYIQF